MADRTKRKPRPIRLAEFLGMENREGILLTQTELSALNGKRSQQGGGDVKNPE